MSDDKYPTVKATAGDESADGAFLRDIDVEFLIHELKDPISVIATALRLLLEKPAKYGPLTDRQLKTLKRALRNSKKAANLLADLLEVGRSDAGCFQCSRFDALATVDEVLMEVLEAADAGLWEHLQEMDSGINREGALSRHGIHIVCSDEARQVQLYQDEIKFRQIVGNLVKNAFHHRRRRLEIALARQEERLVIDIVDDGPGVENENQELIFERYTRIQDCALTSRSGHGLGLAGARIMARHLGGEITVSSHRGQGAAFCLTLPLEFRDLQSAAGRRGGPARQL